MCKESLKNYSIKSLAVFVTYLKKIILSYIYVLLLSFLVPTEAVSANVKDSSKKKNKSGSILFHNSKDKKSSSKNLKKSENLSKAKQKTNAKDNKIAKSTNNKVNKGSYTKLSKSKFSNTKTGNARLASSRSRFKITKSRYRSLGTKTYTDSVISKEEIITNVVQPPSDTEYYNEFEKISKTYSSNDSGGLSHIGPFKKNSHGNYIDTTRTGEKVLLTLDSNLQQEAENILSELRVSNGALVAIDPTTGKILALAGQSDLDSNGQMLVTRNTLPAASLFKMITAAAAVETSGLTSNSEVFYRGGTYSLGKHNYLPSSTQDRLSMNLGYALGKSCNPVFARLALNNLNSELIKQYAINFGFYKNIAQDFPLPPSTLNIGDDKYSLARTAAGFGAAYISPIHAAAIAGAIGNKGLMMKPYIIDSIIDNTGKITRKTKSQVLSQSIRASTADEVIEMMESTITDGTARKHFKNTSNNLKKVSIAGKTGTLKGISPKGLYLWFVAVAPVENPTIAVAALVIDNGRSRSGGVGLGKKLLEKYFNGSDSTNENRLQKTAFKIGKPKKVI